MKQHLSMAPHGSILLLALIVASIIMAMTVAFFGYFGSAAHAKRVGFTQMQASALAEAGVDQAVYQLNHDFNYAGESGTILGRGTFDVSIASINSTTKRLTVTGYVPNAITPIASRTIQVTLNINSSTVSFRYGVQVGAGGISMATGSVVTGNIFSNGSINGSGTITGDATIAMGANMAADQQWSVQDSGTNIGDTSADADVAQSFTPTTSASLTRVSLNLQKIGNPNDLTIKIVTNSGGKPTKTVLASGTISSSLITNSYGFVDVTLNGTPALTAGQTYWIIVVASVNANNYFKWGSDSASGYSRGSAAYSSRWDAHTPVWTSLVSDLDFAVYLSGLATSLSGVTVQGNAWAASLSNCTVGGTASYQSISSCSITGAQYPNTDPTTPQPFAVSDAQISDWEAVAQADGVIAGPYTISGTQTLGPKKINGDLTISNGTALILSGPVWVNGNITLSNNSTLGVAQSTGTSGAVLIADAIGNTATKGIVDLSNNITVNGNGSNTTPVMIISTNTGNRAIELSNNAASIILYAPYGGIEVSNGANANQVTAKKIELENNASVTYMSGLQNASFSNGPGGSWAVVPGTYAITH